MLVFYTEARVRLEAVCLQTSMGEGIMLLVTGELTRKVMMRTIYVPLLEDQPTLPSQTSTPPVEFTYGVCIVVVAGQA